MSKKVTATLVIAIMLLCLIPTTSFAKYGDANSYNSHWFDEYLISIFYSKQNHWDDNHQDDSFNWGYHDKKKHKKRWEEYCDSSYKIWKKFYCW